MATTDTTPHDPLWPQGGRPLCRRCAERPVYLAGLCSSCYAADGNPSRVPVNIDPAVRAALQAHLGAQGKYAGTGVGYSEFIRRAIEADGGPVPASVAPDTRSATDMAGGERGAQCTGYHGDPGASAPRCEGYAGHPGAHYLRPMPGVTY